MSENAYLIHMGEERRGEGGGRREEEGGRGEEGGGRGWEGGGSREEPILIYQFLGRIDRWMRRMDRRLGGESNREIGFVSFVRACVRAAAAAAACERAKLCARERESVPPPARAGTRQISSGISSGTPPLQSDLSN